MLFGRLLLLEGLKKLGYASDCLHTIKFDKNHRPYIDQKVDFNLTHSGQYVVCAITTKGRVGIDIEKNKEIDLSYFEKYFHPAHWSEVVTSQDKYRAFYDTWSKIESVIKADGRGLGVPIQDICLTNNETVLDGKKWHVSSLDIASNYSCSVALDFEPLSVEVTEVSF